MSKDKSERLSDLQIYLKSKLKSKQLDVNFFNDYIVTSIEQGILKDVTPMTTVKESNQLVNGVLEFPDGTQFRIVIWGWATGEEKQEGDYSKRAIEVYELSGVQKV
jgi:hypothetical protein